MRGVAFAAAVAVAAVGVSVAAPAAADVVVFQTSGSGPTISPIYSPQLTAGTYDFNITATIPVAFEFRGFIDTHYDVFALPPPRPHEEALDGNNSPSFQGKSGLASDYTFRFIVPEDEITSFVAGSQYVSQGVAPGSTVYGWRRVESAFVQTFVYGD